MGKTMKERMKKPVTKTETSTQAVVDDVAPDTADAHPIGFWIDRFWDAERTGDPVMISTSVDRILAIDPHWGANIPAVIRRRPAS